MPPVSPPAPSLLDRIAACRVCEAHLPLGPRPVVHAADPKARILVIGHAPGTKVHASGIPWDDASGKRLRDWLGVTPAQFYDQSIFASIPMGFCYPGRVVKGKNGGGDNPPRPECAPLWHKALLDTLPNIELTVLIGSHALAYYLKPPRAETLGGTVKAWRDHAARGYFPLVHPSPRNLMWLRKNPWFEAEIVPELRARVKALLPE